MPNNHILRLQKIYDYDSRSLVKAPWGAPAVNSANPYNGNHNTRKNRLGAPYHDRTMKYDDDAASLAFKAHYYDVSVGSKPRGDPEGYRRFGEWHNLKPELDTEINRLRFWVFTPEGLVPWSDGDQNVSFHFGTYTKSRSDVDDPKVGQESEASHFYHYYGLRGVGQWNQVIVDPRPSNQRDQEGSCNTDPCLDAKNIPYPDDPDGPNDNYFTCMTTHYCRVLNTMLGGTWPKYAFFSSIEGYWDDSGEDVTWASNPTGLYDPSSNTFKLGWQSKRYSGDDDPEKTFDIRYSFEDTRGENMDRWNELTVPSNSRIKNSLSKATRGWDSIPDEIEFGANEFVYFAIKALGQADNRYRQICIPVTGKRPPA